MMDTRAEHPSHAASPGRTSLVAALLVLLSLVVGAAACDKPSAFGETDSLILVADADLWAELEQETYEALEPTLFTVREERTFHVTHAAADGEDVEQLLMWRQVLVFAVPGDERIREIADEAGREEMPTAGRILQAQDVWARGQLATAVVLDPDDRAGSWRAVLPELAALLDQQFREYATSRMFVSGVDTAFAESMAERYGVALRVPQIYHGRIGEDGRIRLRNDRPTPADRIRSILIERREPGAARAASGDSLGAEAVYAWREGVDSVAYSVPQAIERPERLEPRRFELDGAEAIEVQGIWRDEGTYPAAGPFVARAVECPDATWFFDAWLYSPHPEDSKYEFMIQLEEILDSFRCSTD